MKTTQKQQAKDLFFGTNMSRKEIAENLAIDEKTLYLWIKKEAWDEHKKAAHAAPAIIVDNLCYMLVELQDHISERATGLRFPTAQEADTMRKIINSITKMKEYTSVGANMQMMVDFTNHISADAQFCTQLQAYAESYFKARKANLRYNNNFGFGSEQSPAATEQELNEIKDNILADIDSDYSTDTYEPTLEIYPAENWVETQEFPDSNFTNQSGISTSYTAETLINRAFDAVSATAIHFPVSGKIGNSTATTASNFKRPTFLNRNKKQGQHHINSQSLSNAA
jgi:hypothetical protein